MPERGADLHEQPISDRVAEGVVDAFEAIEVEQEDRIHGVRIAGAESRSQAVVEPAPIGQPSQIILVGQGSKLVTGAIELVCSQLQFGMCGAERRAGRNGLGRRHFPFDLSFHTGESDLEDDRFRDVVVRLQPQALHQHLRLGPCRDHDHRQLCDREPLSHLLERLDAAHAGHHDVEQHRVEPGLVEGGQCSLPVSTAVVS